jgi:intein/homing endonuclease
MYKNCFLFDVKQNLTPQINNFKLEWIESKDIAIGDSLLCPKTDYKEIPKDVINLKEIPTIRNNNIIIGNEIYKKSKNSRFSTGFKGKKVFSTTDIEVTEELMRLFGYYASKGNSNYHGTITFSFHIDEKEYMDDMIYLMQKNFNLKNYKIRYKKDENYNVIVYGNVVIAELLSILLGNKAANKKIPNLVFISDKNFQIQFLRGLLRGENKCLGKTNLENINKVKKCLVSLSPDLTDQTFDMLMNFGVYTSIKKKKNPKIRGYRQISYTLNVSSKRSHNKLMMLLNNNLSDIKKSKSVNVKSEIFQLLKVRRIEEINYNGVVHNISVEDDNSYICENVAVHNCLPAAEAGACEIPVITTKHGGQLEFLNDERAELVEPEGEETCKRLKLNLISSSYGPNILIPKLQDKFTKDFSEKMIDVYENYEEAKKKAKKLREHLCDDYTWDIAARKIILRLFDIKRGNYYAR